ncbi:MAG: N-formylglutamate amidohydrolase [Hyphomicrobium sp.]|nr:N-formylglutamate amidohydrolase [Hyphomicrobium sp.]
MPPLNTTAIPQEFFPSFDVLRPAEQTAAFVFSSPHCGRIYPAEFLAMSRLDPQTLRKSEDWYVDRLFSGVAKLGAPLLSARFPRAYLDLNREPYELDPELVDEALPEHANTQSVRVAGGLGTVARIVADGEEIYAGPLSLQEVLTRIDQLYFPFHTQLARLIDETVQGFGYGVLIDCHSMPSALMTPGGGARPDFVIGDRYGASADPRLSQLARETLAGLGYDAQMNRPYAGGYITEHHGRPGGGVHAIQIEINRGIYMNETTLQQKPGFDRLKADLDAFASHLFATAPALFEMRSAAE